MSSTWRQWSRSLASIAYGTHGISARYRIAVPMVSAGPRSFMNGMPVRRPRIRPTPDCNPSWMRIARNGRIGKRACQENASSYTAELLDRGEVHRFAPRRAPHVAHLLDAHAHAHGGRSIERGRTLCKTPDRFGQAADGGEAPPDLCIVGRRPFGHSSHLCSNSPVARMLPGDASRQREQPGRRGGVTPGQ